MSDIKATIGTDPEFFLTNDKGAVISAIPHVPGGKYEPHILPISKSGLQTDNVAVEFATEPFDNVDAFINNLKETFKEIKALLPEGHGLAVLPSTIFPDSELQHEQAKEFGCSPDFDVWKMEQNEPPTPENQNLRSCGGHIHVGHEALEELGGKTMFVKLMDCFHGMVATVLDSSEDAIERRKLYGKAGCHRPTSYGIEYRVLSNYWLKHPKLVKLQYSLVEDALAILGIKGERLIKTIGQDNIIKTINTGNKREAESIINSYIMYHMSQDSRRLYHECKELDQTAVLAGEWEV